VRGPTSSADRYRWSATVHEGAAGAAARAFTALAVGQARPGRDALYLVAGDDAVYRFALGLTPDQRIDLGTERGTSRSSRATHRGRPSERRLRRRPGGGAMGGCSDTPPMH
jgi:hypothetical protein